MGIGNRISDEKVIEDVEAISVQPSYSFSDLVLPEITKSSLLDFLSYQKHQDLIFNQWGLSDTHKYHRQTAINFYGEPGTGKTMGAHAVAHELGKPLVIVNYAELESKYVGETSKNITKLFMDAKKCNGIILFDEADAMLSRRVSDMRSSSDVSVNQTRSVLLTLMNTHDGLIIFTTNFIENYDPAFMRRILSHVNFVLPDRECRLKLWGNYISGKLPKSVDIKDLADASNGLSGSDISNCVLKAAMQAARQGLDIVSLDNFLSAIKEVNNSKEANIRKTGGLSVERREVSEDYVKSVFSSNNKENVGL